VAAMISTVATDRRGFTLVEIIVGIVVSAILAVIITQIVSGQSLRSYWPIQRIDEKLVLQEAMNEISAEHRRLLMIDPQPLITLQGLISAPEYWSGKSFSGRVALDVTNTCIQFNANREDPDQAHANCDLTDKILKVTLQIPGSGQRLTALFTR
jgi:prepilin-type N-terminal cleavage/methylation domain-containing protein